ncbi:MAG: hypothetical protein JWO65_2546 [Sphingomonas bacterium]|jgi:hypothetical protein|nr:hypothetical protein [Sphingomonas bacterium]
MSSFKDPTFEERRALAMQAKQKALDKLRAKPPVDDAVLAERTAARLVREAAEVEAREARRLVREQEKTDRKAAQIAKAEAEAAAKPVELTDAEKKALRDAKYAARKNRKK